MPSMHIIYASTSGHTEYVVDLVSAYLQEHASDITVTAQQAETATAEDFDQGDVLCLASSTWNTGGTEGMPNPHMFMLLYKHAKAVDLQQKPVVLIGLGDQRYTFTCRAADKLEEFVVDHNGTHIGTTLRVINEPYHQKDKVEQWTKDIVSLLTNL